MRKKTIKKGGANIEDCINKKKLWNPKTNRCVKDTKINRNKGAITPIKKNKSSSFNKKGYNKNGYDRNGNWWYGSDGYDKDGYDVNGYDREGYDVNGYDIDGYNVNGNKKLYKKKTMTNDSLLSQINKITPTSAIIDINDGIEYPELKFKTNIKVGGTWLNFFYNNSNELNKKSIDIPEEEKEIVIKDTNEKQYTNSLNGEDMGLYDFKNIDIDNENINNNLLLLLVNQLNNPLNNTMISTIIHLIVEKQEDMNNYDNDLSLYNHIKNYPELIDIICKSKDDDGTELYRLKGIGSLTNDNNMLCK